MQSHFKNLKKILNQQLNAAETSIFTAVAWFTEPDVFNTLCQKAKDGVKVIVIISDDTINFKETYSLDFEYLKSCGGQFFKLESRFLHHKFSIIDDKILITGSANYTKNGLFKNAESLIIITEPNVIAEHLAEFKNLLDFNVFETQVVFVDASQRLKVEIEFLLNQIGFLENELATAEKYLAIYENQYHTRFKVIILEILALEIKLAESKAKYTGKNEEIDKLNFLKNQQSTFEAPSVAAQETLNEEEGQNIKTLFREAVKLCHPDSPLVPANKKEIAAEVFSTLKNAYKAGNLELVSEILEDLKSGLKLKNIDYSHSSNHDLEAICTKLQNQLAALSQKVESIKQNKKYILANNTITLKQHYDEIEMLFNEKLRVLKLGS